MINCSTREGNMDCMTVPKQLMRILAPKVCALNRKVFFNMVQHVSLQLSSVIVVVSLLSSPEARNSKGLPFSLRQNWANYNYLGTKKCLALED